MPAPTPARRLEDRALPLRRRLAQILGVLAALLTVAAVLLGLTVQDLRSAQARVQDQLLPAVVDAQALLDLAVNQETGQRGFVITGDSTFLQPYDTATARLPQVVADLRRHAALPDTGATLERVLAAHNSWVALSAEPEIAAVRAGDLAGARRLVAAGDGRVLFDALRARLDDLQQRLNASLAQANDRVRALSSRLVWLLAVALTVTAGGLGLLYPALQALLLRPLQALAVTARRAGDDRAAPVLVGGPREVVAAGRAVEGMRRRLVEQVDAARQASQALAQRGPAVLALRDALTPRPVRVPGLEVLGALEAAEGFLAGDWLDLIELDGGRLGLVVGDVAGHGPEQAVFALRLKHLLSSALLVGLAPGQALEFTAGQLGETGEAFATVLVAVLDPAAGRVQHANAGHPAGLLLRPEPAQQSPRASGTSGPQAVQRRPAHEARVVPARRGPAVAAAPVPAGVRELEPTGPLLSSLVAGWSWGTTSHDLRMGDVLLAYTDGLVEGRDAAGEQFGPQRVQALAAAAVGGRLGLPALIGDLQAAATGHAGQRGGDDCTVVACRRVPEPDRA